MVTAVPARADARDDFNLLTSNRIARFLEDINEMRRGIDTEVDGWRIRRPTLAELDGSFEMFVAESVADDAKPLSLPHDSLELCVAVMHGAVRVDGFEGLLYPQSFFVVRPKDSRSVYAVMTHTKITCFFFRMTPPEDPASAVAA